MTRESPLSAYGVLYLEDEALIAFDTSEHLRELGFEEVTCAYRLKNAVAAAKERHYDLAILDINVDAGQTSVALGKELASKGTQVVFASGSSMDAKVLREEGFRFLSKPFTLDGLTRVIHDLLRSKA